MAPQTLARVPAEISPAAHRQALSELLTPLGCEHQLAIPYVLGPRVHRAFVLSRPEDDFTEEDLELARLLQPLLRGLHRQTTVLSGIPAVTVQALQRIGLTAREAAVLSLAGTGMTTGSIAHRLGMAPGTVRKHLEHIHRKLGVTSRMEATQLAARLAAEGLSVSSREPGRRTLVR